MAKRKYSRTRKSTSALSLKRWFYSLTWFAVVILILFFIGRFILSDRAAKAENVSQKPMGDLELVVVPANLASVTHAYKGYTTYFNPDWHIPNCVSYELTRSETEGTNPRYKNFETDKNISGSANPWDYTNSGYDRGHMAPAADMKWDRDVMRETFLMSNIAPQVHSLNAGAWKSLEEKLRDWAQRDSAIIIVTGPIVSPNPATIGDSKVVVPDAFFKVVLAPYAKPVRAIGFIFANEKSRAALDKHCVSVDDVEKATGLDFFSNLPDDIETSIEAQCNPRAWEQRQF